MELTYRHWEVFSQIPHQGNPAAVVEQVENLSTEDMQIIANKIGYSETIFLLPSACADFRLRFFSPGSEMPLCGHGTIAAVSEWYAQQAHQPQSLTIETLAGALTIGLEEVNGQLWVEMTQALPQFQPFDGEVERLASSLGLTVDDVDPRYPLVYGSTGSWTLIVPVKDLAVMKKMRPNNQQFPEILTSYPQASVHPICLDTYHEECLMHGRHFSGAGTGTIEDPVTGTASGVMGAYYRTYIAPQGDLPLTMMIEQGQEMGKDGRLGVTVERVEAQLRVKIKGQALLVSKELLKL
ncbi:PhzF family phenazine biosynthesis protein [Vagococcus zengguangii]|uniref:PhzF family phenazine biosynthesis isomerase n=1 Tax=Vagococcus zengguangii TaxID=2571750 RepID=A0A4D7CVJ2_9ENTE|nr:PhzF family phenazine biosynthesis isomerase [Vagococcus zengguangii]QCI87262.1 PhzF family phenazine biosynthesis isomerase [Vagococcus zengguangii]TLG80766.1 PhzF family phenazine biosynthesis isomerase [Vagococcus zengguangii]